MNLIFGIKMKLFRKVGVTVCYCCKNRKKAVTVTTATKTGKSVVQVHLNSFFRLRCLNLLWVLRCGNWTCVCCLDECHVRVLIYVCCMLPEGCYYEPNTRRHLCPVTHGSKRHVSSAVCQRMFHTRLPFGVLKQDLRIVINVSHFGGACSTHTIDNLIQSPFRRFGI